MNQEIKRFYIGSGVITIIGLMGAMIAIASFFIVEPGQIAVHMRMGTIKRAIHEPGVYFKWPAFDLISYLPGTICKSNIKTEALSHDLQFVELEVAINFKLTDAIKLHKEVGLNFYENVLEPCTQETMKAVIAQYTAEELIQKRNQVNSKVAEALRERLSVYPLHIIDFNFIHLNFHQDFITAVERKQIALQSALTAKNLTEKIKEEALQTREQADAEAYSMKVRQQTATKEVILLRALEKWDGKLPRIITSQLSSFIKE